jgi:hypothetical protein
VLFPDQNFGVFASIGQRARSSCKMWQFLVGLCVLLAGLRDAKAMVSFDMVRTAGEF